jgi:hypothetical protein
MTIFKGRRVALSCAQGIVYIKVIEDLEAPNQIFSITCNGNLINYFPKMCVIYNYFSIKFNYINKDIE